MIYTKDAIFPYPVLRNGSNDYKEDSFSLNVELEENTTDFFFKVSYEIESMFLEELILEGKAELIFLIQARDNKFFVINSKEQIIKIPKNRLSLDKRTSTQLMLRAIKDISFAENTDLNEYYEFIKEDILVESHSVLAISNVVIYDGSITKPFELFEKRLNPDLRSEIAIEIGEDTIIINYKSENLQFAEFANSKELNYPYIYMGLQRALTQMIQVLSDNGEDAVYLDEIGVPENGLMFKLYNLMKSKHVEELNMDKIDEVIDKISDRMMNRFYKTVKEMSTNAG